MVGMVGRIYSHGGSSAYRGVCWNRHQGSWQAQIRHQRNVVHLGYFEDEASAARAYDAKAVKLRGRTAALNFPESAALNFPPVPNQSIPQACTAAPAEPCRKRAASSRDSDELSSVSTPSDVQRFGNNNKRQQTMSDIDVPDKDSFQPLLTTAIVTTAPAGLLNWRGFCALPNDPSEAAFGYPCYCEGPDGGGQSEGGALAALVDVCDHAAVKTCMLDGGERSETDDDDDELVHESPMKLQDGAPLHLLGAAIQDTFDGEVFTGEVIEYDMSRDEVTVFFDVDERTVKYTRSDAVAKRVGTAGTALSPSLNGHAAEPLTELSTSERNAIDELYRMNSEKVVNEQFMLCENELCFVGRPCPSCKRRQEGLPARLLLSGDPSTGSYTLTESSKSTLAPSTSAATESDAGTSDAACGQIDLAADSSDIGLGTCVSDALSRPTHACTRSSGTTSVCT